MEKEKTGIWKRAVLLAVLVILFLTQKVLAKESLQMEQKSSLINSVIKPKAASYKLKSELVYKLNGNYYTVNTYGNTSYAKISRNVDFYLKYQFDSELAQGSVLKTYVTHGASGIWSPTTYTLQLNGNGYYYDRETHNLYIPISNTLKNEQDSIRLGYDITLANGNIIEKFDSSTDGFYVTLLGEYTVSYNANGGVGAPEPQTKYRESSLALSSTRPVQTGYTFKGWAPGSTVTSAMYQPGDSYTSNSDITLYAVWEINKYSISYNANGGNAAPLTQTKNYGESLILSSTKPIRTGYTFKGWATNSTANTASYQPGESYTDNQNITLYAVWEQDLCAPNVESPTAKSVKAGTAATFSVRASGGNPNNYTYQWYYSTSQNGTGTRISGAIASSYTINASDMSSGLNGRYYYCVVSNGEFDITSNRAKLTVYSAPTVEAPVEKSVKEGTDAVFSVRASGGYPDSYSYQWYYALSSSGTGTRINGATSATYTILSVNMTAALSGRYYYCEVSNGQYTVKSSRAKLTVLKNDTESPEGSNNTGNGGNSGNSSTGAGSSSGTNSGAGDGHTVSRPVLQVIQAVSYTKEYGSKSFFLQASTNGNGKLTYQSSNKKVAEVSSDGQVKLKGYGTAIITIQASQTPAYQAASKQITINVIPKKTALKKVQSPISRKISLRWKKNKQAAGYEIYISSNKTFKSHTVKRTYPKSKTSAALIGLQSGKKYYVKIRSYAKAGKKKSYSEWSKAKSVRIK